MDHVSYRSSDTERARIADLMALVPAGMDRVLDIGARDGFLSKLLAQRCGSVVALDLELPVIEGDRISCVQGNASALDFPEAYFDLVFCAEVLEHIEPRVLGKACEEIGRVSRKYLLLGVPYKQDIRDGRTTCYTCGAKNPPGGHVNQFDKRVLARLFHAYDVVTTAYVGQTEARTNFLSTWLLAVAGNPYGLYAQIEPCVSYDAPLMRPHEQNLVQKICSRLALYGNRVQALFSRPQPN